MNKLIALLLLIALPVCAQSAPWQHPLYLDNGGLTARCKPSSSDKTASP
jgi:hypothetical protein